MLNFRAQSNFCFYNYVNYNFIIHILVKRNYFPEFIRVRVFPVFSSKLDSPKGEFTGLLTQDRNIVLYENEKFTKTKGCPESQLPAGSQIIRI